MKTGTAEAREDSKNDEDSEDDVYDREYIGGDILDVMDRASPFKWKPAKVLIDLRDMLKV